GICLKRKNNDCYEYRDKCFHRHKVRKLFCNTNYPRTSNRCILPSMDNQRQLFQRLFEENSKRVYHLCYGYTGDSDSANDLMQETFIKVWQNLDQFRNQSQFSTWIYRIAINTCLSYLRT